MPKVADTCSWIGFYILIQLVNTYVICFYGIFFYLYHELQHVNVCVCSEYILFKDIFGKNREDFLRGYLLVMQKEKLI